MWREGLAESFMRPRAVRRTCGWQSPPPPSLPPPTMELPPPQQQNFERVRVVLKRPVWCPPIPDDECVCDHKGRVYARFAHSVSAKDAQEAVHVGWITPRRDPSVLDEEEIFGPPKKVRLKSSGDGHTIACVIEKQ